MLSASIGCMPGGSPIAGPSRQDMPGNDDAMHGTEFLFEQAMNLSDIGAITPDDEGAQSGADPGPADDKMTDAEEGGLDIMGEADHDEPSGFTVFSRGDDPIITPRRAFAGMKGGDTESAVLNRPSGENASLRLDASRPFAPAVGPDSGDRVPVLAAQPALLNGVEISALSEPQPLSLPQVAVMTQAGQADMVRQAPGGAPIPRQIAEAVIRMDGERAEITLSPEELGTVRIALSREADRLVVRLWADRPETLDLMRRHADQLTRELAAAGEESTRLDLLFAERGPGSNANRGREGPRQSLMEEGGPEDMAPIDENVEARRIGLSGRLDLRL